MKSAMVTAKSLSHSKGGASIILCTLHGKLLAPYQHSFECMNTTDHYIGIVNVHLQYGR